MLFYKSSNVVRGEITLYEILGTLVNRKCFMLTSNKGLSAVLYQVGEILLEKKKKLQKIVVTDILHLNSPFISKFYVQLSVSLCVCVLMCMHECSSKVSFTNIKFMLKKSASIILTYNTGSQFSLEIFVHVNHLWIYNKMIRPDQKSSIRVIKKRFSCSVNPYSADGSDRSCITTMYAVCLLV